MITITPKNNFKNGFTVEGHANAGAHGQDIVCASVSVLTQAILNGLIKYTTPSYTLASGYIDVEIEYQIIEAIVLLETFEASIKDIASQYPEYIQIKYT